MEYPIAYNNGKHCCNKFEEFTTGKNLLAMATDSCHAMATETCNGDCEKCPVQGIITSGLPISIKTEKECKSIQSSKFYSFLNPGFIK